MQKIRLISIAILFIILPHVGAAQESLDAELDAMQNETSQNEPIEDPATQPLVESSPKETQRQELKTEPIQVYDTHSEYKSGRGEVIVEQQINNLLPYKQRRTPYGVLFSVNYEQFKPVDYFSFIQKANYDKVTDSKSIPLMGIELGFKYNFSLGAVAAIAGYSTGKIDNGSLLEEMSASITKFDLNFTLDGIMNEPYIAPYIQVGLHSIDWTERSVDGVKVLEENFTTHYNLHYKAGLSFQLNWIENSIDPQSTEEARISSGLDNTYLDVFYSVYNEPDTVALKEGDEGEANLNSEQFGVGLKLEF